MALTYGFFDAIYDGETGTYDRTYNSGNFTEYFDKILGSGVCVYGNANSMRVSANGMEAIVAPGYLFINGRWLKNDADYTLDMSSAEAGIYAIVTRLDLSARVFTLGYEAVAEEYSSALVLAYVTVSAGALTVTDMRADTTVCGMIDGAGALANKITAALNYIDNDIPAEFSVYDAQLQEWQAGAAGALSDAAEDFSGQISKLTETIQDEVDDLNGDVTAEISAVNTAVNAKTAEVNAALATVPTPAVGDIDYTAADAKSGFLPCDGRYISSTEYPDLVDKLGKLSPGTNELIVRSDGEIGRQISNGYIYNGRLWVYSYYAKALYGVSLSGAATVSIPVTSTDGSFSEMVAPSIAEICLTIIDGYLFLTQWRTGSDRADSGITATDTYLTVLCVSGFTGEESALELVKAVTYGTIYQKGLSLPYVQKETLNGTNYFVMPVGLTYKETYAANYTVYTHKMQYWRWTSFGDSPTIMDFTLDVTRGNSALGYYLRILHTFNRKNNREMVSRYTSYDSKAYIDSAIKSTYRSQVITGFSSREYITSDETPVIGNDLLYLGGAANRKVYYISTTQLNPVAVDISSVISLPSGSEAFPDAAVYCADKNMWFIFVGTGIIFTHDLTDAAAYGFLNTTAELGALSNYGYMDYDEDTSTLVIVGQDADGVVKVTTLDLTGWQYSSTGAYLPTISSGGIPAYIKAVRS